MGYVTQEPVLFRATVFQNVAHGLVGSEMESLPEVERRRLVEEACHQANAHDFITSLPAGYETQIGERGLLLSGGQKQRIAIARAIVKNPRILLLDEATSALDTQSEKVVQQALERASNGRTTVVIAHRLSTVRNADKIVVMSRGHVVETGKHSSLMAITDGMYRKMVELQKIDVGQAKQSAAPAVLLDNPDKVVIATAAAAADESKQMTAEEKGAIELQQVKVDGKYGSDPPRENRFANMSAFGIFLCVTRLNFPELNYMLVGFLGSIITGVTMPVFAVLFGSVLQVFFSTGDKLREDTNFWALMFLVIAICGFIGNMLKFVMFGLSGEKLTTRIRDQSFRAMLRQEVGWFDEDRNSVGQLTTSLSSNAQQLQNMSGTILGSILELSVSIIGAAIVSLTAGWKLGLVVLSCLPLSILANKLRMDLMRKGNLATKEHYERSAQVACEAVGAMRTVAALTRERELVNRYAKDLKAPLAIGHHHAIFGSILYAASQGFANLTNALAFWYGGQLFITDGYDVRQMFVVLMASMFAGQASGSVFSLMPDMSRSILYAKDTLALLERRPKIDSQRAEGRSVDPSTVQGTVEFKSVRFSYPTRPSIPVLSDLNLTVRPGQYIALVGASGCGKSTCIALMQRLYDVTSGAIEIDGQPIDSLNLRSLRNVMTIVSQEPSLFDMSIRDNIRLGIADNDDATSADGTLVVTDSDVERAAREANIHEFITQLPQGYETKVGSKGSQLSGGQKQRIAIARALLLKPKILLLDEATSALDGQSEKAVQDTLDQAAKGRTTVSIAHRLSTIKGADQIYVFQRGRIVEHGTHEELVSREGGLYRTLAAQQDLNS
jgi:ATP-binding cassette subfamily B (MDR/TAP) protein 1